MSRIERRRLLGYPAYLSTVYFLQKFFVALHLIPYAGVNRATERKHTFVVTILLNIQFISVIKIKKILFSQTSLG